MTSVFDVRREIERGRERLKLEGREQREKAEECVYHEIIEDAKKNLRFKGMAEISGECRNMVETFSKTMCRLGDQTKCNISYNRVQLDLHLQQRGWNTNEPVSIHLPFAHYSLE